MKKSKRTRAKRAPRPPQQSSAPSLIGALKYPGAARFLGISEATLRRATERGLIRPNKMFRHVLFPIEELQRALREGMSK
jgi:Helix-turn-helix domain